MKTNNIKNALSIIITAFIFISFTACKKDSLASGGGYIEYTVDGKTYKQTDDVGAVFISGKFQGLTDGNLDAKVGDSQDISITTGTAFSPMKLIFTIDGKTYGNLGNTSKAKVTFTKIETNLLEGTFEGIIKENIGAAYPAKSISGKFSIKSITRI
jgi:hypothetical protein